jgi:succinoglycan biosynthesis protein ExoA
MLMSKAETRNRTASTVDARDVLVVVPTLNEAAHIETCLRSLLEGDQQVRDIPVVVADGGSTDRTVEIVTALQAEFPNLRVLHNPKRLQAAALNLAVAEHGEAARYLVRCDAHSIYPPDFIIAVVAQLAATGAASVVVPMDAIGHTCFEKANAWIVDTKLGSGGAAHRAGKASGYVDHGHHAGFDLNMYRRIGGYDEHFSHNEDAEYDYRVTAAGGRIYMDADIRIQYIPRASVPRLARQYFNYGKGRARNILKHGGRLKLRQALPILTFLACLIGLIGGTFFTPALILPSGYVALLLGASLVMAVRKASVCGLLTGLASGTMHMSWAAGFLVQSLRGYEATGR